MITGGIKTTPIAALEIASGITPLKHSREKAVLKMNERIIRTPNSIWESYKPSVQRLKKKHFASKIEEIYLKYNIKLIKNPKKFGVVKNLLFSNNQTIVSMKIKSISMSKENYSNIELKNAFLEMIEVLYPTSEWFHIYTDGSLNEDKAGAGVFSNLFEIKSSVGSNATSFDAELKAISLALGAIMKHKISERYQQIVIFVDSKCALLSLRNTEYGDNGVSEFISNSLGHFQKKRIKIVFQWVPSHAGIHGNEMADKLANVGNNKPQKNFPLKFTTVKNLIENTFKGSLEKYYNEVSEGKPWKELLLSLTALRARLMWQLFVVSPDMTFSENTSRDSTSSNLRHAIYAI